MGFFVLRYYGAWAERARLPSSFYRQCSGFGRLLNCGHSWASNPQHLQGSQQPNINLHFPHWISSKTPSHLLSHPTKFTQAKSSHMPTPPLTLDTGVFLHESSPYPESHSPLYPLQTPDHLPLSPPQFLLFPPLAPLYRATLYHTGPPRSLPSLVPSCDGVIPSRYVMLEYSSSTVTRVSARRELVIRHCGIVD